MGIAAPGVEIYSLLPGNGYGPKSGTSMATPLVGGTLTLMKAFYPDMTAKEAYFLLEKTGKKLESGSQTGKLIQPYAALQEIMD